MILWYYDGNFDFWVKRECPPWIFNFYLVLFFVLTPVKIVLSKQSFDILNIQFILLVDSIIFTWKKWFQV